MSRIGAMDLDEEEFLTTGSDISGANHMHSNVRKVDQGVAFSHNRVP